MRDSAELTRPFRCGANVNAVDEAGFSAMHLNASWSDSDEHAVAVAELLSSHGARVDLPTKNGATVDQLAAASPFPRLTAFLSDSHTRERFGHMRRCVRAAACALAKARLVCDAADRGPLFGTLTRWLDVELVAALAPELTSAQHDALVRAIATRTFFESREALAVHILGKEHQSIAAFD